MSNALFNLGLLWHKVVERLVGMGVIKSDSFKEFFLAKFQLPPYLGIVKNVIFERHPTLPLVIKCHKLSDPPLPLVVWRNNWTAPEPEIYIRRFRVIIRPYKLALAELGKAMAIKQAKAKLNYNSGGYSASSVDHSEESSHLCLLLVGVIIIS